MGEIWKNKKIINGVLVICILIMVGLLIGIALKGDGDETEAGKTGSEQEDIVYEADKDTVEEEAEGGLTVSDSDDGPILNEDDMIDFNGSDAEDDDKADSDKTDNESGGNETTGNDNPGNASDNSEDSGNDNAGNGSGDNAGNGSEGGNPDDSTEDDENDSEDTGSWGPFY